MIETFEWQERWSGYSVMAGQELIELIEDALLHFAHSECPYCQVNISIDKYVDEDDIMRWLTKEGHIEPNADA